MNLSNDIHMDEEVVSVLFASSRLWTLACIGWPDPIHYNNIHHQDEAVHIDWFDFHDKDRKEDTFHDTSHHSSRVLEGAILHWPTNSSYPWRY